LGENRLLGVETAYKKNLFIYSQYSFIPSVAGLFSYSVF